jgi:autotransporter-associated beta strand protein
MFFDNNGYLFSGGDGITVFQPNGTISYDQPSSVFPTLTYDPANNEVLVVPYGSSTGDLYNAADFEPASWTNPKGGTWGLGLNWSGRPLSTVGTLMFAGSTSGTAVVTLDGNQSASALQFGDSSAASRYLINAESGGTLTLGTSNGTWITVVSGTHSISAPIALAGSVAITPAANTQLTISGNISESPINSGYSLNLSGPGTLILSGSNSYTGGTTIDGGMLYVTETNAIPEGTSLTIGAGGVFIFDPSAAATQSLEVSQDSPVTVPEPGMLALFAAGGVCFIARRFLRRRRVELTIWSATRAPTGTMLAWSAWRRCFSQRAENVLVPKWPY